MTQIPLRHLSIRVPWHDSGWNGTVCKEPGKNASCLFLERIRELRNDLREEELAGKNFTEIGREDLPPCVKERGCFMAPFEWRETVQHPYAGRSDAHRNFAPTPLRHPAYTAACMPFRWMLNSNAPVIANEYGISYVQEIEDRARDLIGFNTSWIQDKRNQTAMLDTFFGAIRPYESLCFFYAKRIPYVEDRRRVIIGVGRVFSVSPLVEYQYSGESELRAVLWEKSVQHSIRPGFHDGFLFPYQQVLESQSGDESTDLTRFVAFVDEEHWLQFSYGSEHVSHDAAISSLLSCASALRETAKVLPGAWDQQLRWINDRISELWRMRGPCPGLGAALCAFGVDHGTFIAYDIASRLTENDDPWPLVERLFDGALDIQGVSMGVSSTLMQKWKSLPEERRDLLKLISRFDLSIEQATRFYQPTDRKKARIDVSDRELLENPYLIYELDRHRADAIGIGAADRGAFPDAAIREAHPMPETSAIDDATDPRRVRALIVSVMERASEKGNTVEPQSAVIQTIRELPLEPPCPVDQDLMTMIEHHMAPFISRTAMSDGEPAYQLSRLADMGKTIRETVERRIVGRRHDIKVDWVALLDDHLNDPVAPSDEAEILARQEKVAALAELAASRVSVMIGPAGTGKTTLLSVLCAVPQIRDGGVLLLAPTGKARVQMQKSTGNKAQTIAQFLLPLDRYDPETGSYRLSTRAPVQDARTVIIDEASMITEEQIAAVLDGIKGVERLIFVGDPRQLHPIGSGRPFVDIVNRLAPGDLGGRFPRVAPGYAELTIHRRHKGRVRDDLLLAEWFSGQSPGAGADEIWGAIESQIESETLRFVSWKDDDDLREKLLEQFVTQLGLLDPDDDKSFEVSLGGSVFGPAQEVFFRPRIGGNPGSGCKVEEWQVLSPVKGQAHGVTGLNRFIQGRFRKETRKKAFGRGRKIPSPFGPEEIIYGDKVINTVNQWRRDVYPEQDALMYVANGEIGIIVGQYKGKNWKPKQLPWKLQVEFSSQLGFSYGYGGRDFAQEADAKLELAYAITVHKAQGSEFGTTFLILPSPCRLLSRELLYTAITRQRKRVIVMHQGDISELKRYAAPGYSETARRLTNLFGPPTLVKVDERFLEEGLIHHTRRGEAVRSKSEVIIADLLYAKGLADYVYEQRLVGTDGAIRYPDFTVDDAESGVRVYWEHLGMLHDPAYRERWSRKLDWYRTQGILPHEEGGGPQGTLVITRDDENGGINSREMDELITAVFGR